MNTPKSNERELIIDCRSVNLHEMIERINNHFPGINHSELEITIESYCTTTDYSCSGDYRDYFSIKKG
jgi:RNase adaptor protein for sRNA GlmZ degradation